MRRWLAALGFSLLAASPALAQVPGTPEGGTLEQVRARGELRCGVNGGLPGFSAPDPQGVMRGFDADICRAVAAAALSDATRVRFVPQATPEAGFAALEADTIDLLVRNTTLTRSRATRPGIAPGPVVFFDGAGFLVPTSLGISSPRNLGGRTVCWAGAEAGATGLAVRDFAQRHGLTWTVRRFDAPPAAVEALRAGTCHAFVADQGALVTRRITDLPDPDNWAVLPELISQEPLSPWTRAQDRQWQQIVHCTVQVLVSAEANELSAARLPELLASPDPSIRRILGLEPGFGAGLGLPDEWAARVIAAVGHYGEVFERNLGEGSVFGMDRGLNDQWTRGGLLYGMPLR